jgi:WD40 repeat protein
MFYDLVFSPDGRQVAAARNDRTLIVWDVETGDSFATSWWTTRPTGSRSRRTRTDPGLLQDQGHRGMVREGSPQTAGVEAQILPGICGAFSPDGAHAAVAGGGKKVAIFELEQGRELAALDIPHGASVVNFSPTGRLVAAGVLQEKDALTVWDFESRQMKYSIHPGRRAAPTWFSLRTNRSSRTAAFSTDP